MGQCQSRNVAVEQPQHVKKGQSSSVPSSQNGSPLRMFRVRHGSENGNMDSPASDGTKTISPSDNTESTLDSSEVSESDHGLNLLSVLSSPSQKLAPFPEEDEDAEEDEAEQDDNGVNSFSYGVSTPSLLYTNDFESAIPEEEDPDAPSDEEDFLESPAWKEKAGPLVSSSLASRACRIPLTNSPPRTQASIKLRKGRITNPQSIVHRPEPPLVAPNEVQNSIQVSRDAVKPHTMAEFNRLKVQVKLANRQEKVRSRATKLEDRYEDVRGYKSLWHEYELIERKITEESGSESGTPASDGVKLGRSSSFDLKDVDTWFVDFQSMDGSEEEEDNESQCHLSLLSESSMEAQRLLFAEKSAERRRKSEEAKVERRKNRKTVKDAEGGNIEFDGEEKKAEDTPRSQGAVLPQQPALTTPRELFSVKTGGEEDSQDAASESKASSYSQSQLRSAGRDYGPARNSLPESPITNMEVSFSKGSAPRRLVRTDSDLDDTSQLTVDVDDDNDYHVRRRRRRHHTADDLSATSGLTSIISYDEERMELASAEGDGYGLDNLSIPSNEAAIEPEVNQGITRGSPPKPAFGATYLERPEPRWREFSTVKEQVLMNNAAKCLREVYSTKALLSTELENEDVAFAEDEDKLIQIMSTDEFFRMSDGYANPVRLHLPTDTADEGRVEKNSSPKDDYGPAREICPKQSNSPDHKSPISAQVNNVLCRIRDADNKGTEEDLHRLDSNSQLKWSPAKDDTPHEEPGAIVMGFPTLSNMLSATSPQSPAERYMV